MRDFLISIWRKLETVKCLTPLIYFIRWFAGTNLFNIVLDFMETKILHTDYSKTAQYFTAQKERIEKNMQLLEDDRSRFVYSGLLQYRSTHNRKFINGRVDKNQYFDQDLVHFGPYEHFVDCGAYIGDTSEKLIHLVKAAAPDGEIHITAFEPDPSNFQRLQKMQAKYCNECNMKILKKGTWSKPGTVSFASDIEEASRICEEGTSQIEVDSIDHAVGDQRVTFIKMDVEGAETDSLIGAEKTILRDRPLLAISIYHTDSDMVSIIETLAEKYPFYRFYVRHYTYFFGDTVLYAVCDEKQ